MATPVVDPVGTVAILSGEAPELAAAELLTLVEGEGWRGSAKLLQPRLVLVRPALEAPLAAVALERLGLTHRLIALWAEAHFDGSPASLPQRVPLPEGTFCVRVERVSGSWPTLDVPQLQRTLGERWGTAPRNPVSLVDPGTEVRVVLQGELAFIGATFGTIERGPFQKRHVRNRPFFRPVSLSPPIARALVVLSGVRPPQAILDPCCGTGGFLLEAASAGVPCIGADIDSQMVQGALANLDHLGLAATAMVSSPLGELGALLRGRGLATGGMVTDLPYGRSSTLFGSTPERVVEDVLALAMEVLSPGAHIVLVSPQPIREGAVPEGLEVVDRFSLRAHRSLTRYIVRLRRRAPDPAAEAELRKA